MFRFRNLFLILLLFRAFSSHAQDVLISSYCNEADPRDEWTELIVSGDNVDMRNWMIQDDNENQNGLTAGVFFSNNTLWNNLRSGTVIIIHHRSSSSSGSLYDIHADKKQGYIEVSANDPTYFSGGDFGTSPAYSGPSLNISTSGDLVRVVSQLGITSHTLSHRSTPGPDFTGQPLPKLNNEQPLPEGNAVFVCPGGTANQYGNIAPYSGTVYTSTGPSGGTFGLPNYCNGTSSYNTNFWDNLREPYWINPDLSAVANSANTQVSLTWRKVNDLLPSDQCQGYMILRGEGGSPQDGTTYSVGDIIGTSKVVAFIFSSQDTIYVDNYSVPCYPPVSYDVYAYRFNTDPHGNGLNEARGKAYFHIYGHEEVSLSSVQANVSIETDLNPFCPGETANFTATPDNTSIDPSFQWFVNGVATGVNSSNFSYMPEEGDTVKVKMTSTDTCMRPAYSNPIVMQAVVSPVVNVDINVTPGNIFCNSSGVTFHANPTNGGNSPVYQWFLNGAVQGVNSDSWTYVPADGDQVYCVLTSDLYCAGPPDTSATITMQYSAELPVSVAISSSPSGPVCDTAFVRFSAAGVNVGTGSVFQWKINGINAGTNDSVFVYSPADGDKVTCVLNSTVPCATGNPATSNEIVLNVITTVTPEIAVKSEPEFICPDMPVIFTATIKNEGSDPLIEWFIDNNPVLNDSLVLLVNDLKPDQEVFCRLTSSETCVTEDVAVSSPIVLISGDDCYKPVFPSAFTPNGDGLNDYFGPVTAAESLDDLTFQIFDRWGKMIFESHNVNSGWTGVVNGSPAPAGTYSYKITWLSPQTHQKRELKGVVMLVK